MLLIATIVLLWIACAAGILGPVILWFRLDHVLNRLDDIESAILGVSADSLNDNEPPPDRGDNVVGMPRGKARR